MQPYKLNKLGKQNSSDQPIKLSKFYINLNYNIYSSEDLINWTLVRSNCSITHLTSSGLFFITDLANYSGYMNPSSFKKTYDFQNFTNISGTISTTYGPINPPAYLATFRDYIYFGTNEGSFCGSTPRRYLHRIKENETALTNIWSTSSSNINSLNFGSVLNGDSDSASRLYLTSYDISKTTTNGTNFSDSAIAGLPVNHFIINKSVVFKDKICYAFSPKDYLTTGIADYGTSDLNFSGMSYKTVGSFSGSIFNFFHVEGNQSLLIFQSGDGLQGTITAGDGIAYTTAYVSTDGANFTKLQFDSADFNGAVSEVGGCLFACSGNVIRMHDGEKWTTYTANLSGNILKIFAI